MAGLLWGARNGVQFALTFTALKALPVLILGGFTSVPGAIVGGLIIGASEKLAEIYIPRSSREAFGGNFGGIGAGSPMCLPCSFFSSGPRGCSASGTSIGFEERREEGGDVLSGDGPIQDQLCGRSAAFSHTADRIAMAMLLVVAFVAVPLFASEYLFSAILIPFLILSLAALGLNLLTGYAGQLSLGSAAFMAVGAYAAYNFQLRIEGISILASFFLAGLTAAAAVGLLFGLPSLRIGAFTWPSRPWQPNSLSSGV